MKDPVCGMTVDPDQAAAKTSYKDKEYFFCAPGCRDKFLQEPEQYLLQRSSFNLQPGSPDSYTCPMHPEVIQKGPGFCPACGMALEPVTAGVQEENPELLDMQRRFWISALA